MVGIKRQRSMGGGGGGGGIKNKKINTNNDISSDSGTQESLSQGSSFSPVPKEKEKEREREKEKEGRRKSDVNSPKRHHHFTNSNIVVVGTPANHLTTLLLNRLIFLDNARGWDGGGGGGTFLNSVDLLEIIADLVLAFATVAGCIHRYEAGAASPLHKLQHALGKGESVPCTAVSYMLHKLLPHNRSVIVSEDGEVEGKKMYLKVRPRASAASEAASIAMKGGKELRAESRAQRIQKPFFTPFSSLFQTRNRIKTSQNTARVLCALVSRPGQSRRMVVHALSRALNAKNLGRGGSHAEKELWALISWGELTSGIASPKSTKGELQDVGDR